MIAEHPYLACLLFLAIGIAAGWAANAFMLPLREHASDDDITGIGA